MNKQVFDMFFYNFDSINIKVNDAEKFMFVACNVSTLNKKMWSVHFLIFKYILFSTTKRKISLLRFADFA